MDDLDVADEVVAIDPKNLRAELVRQFTTTCRYVRRQGLTEEEMVEVVRTQSVAPQPPLIDVEDPQIAFVRKPDLLGKGIPSRSLSS